ncbi:MAG TPA: S-layer homology domain-containing protein [Thermoanaerobaculia bacterium]|nr:S-layer homology domain-containing protein [Thermoanaerobaculia bacterium]
MHQRLKILTFLFCCLVFVPGLSRATTVIPPDDLGHLARLSDSVAFAQAIESWTEAGGSLPRTITRFQLLERVTGADTGIVFEVVEPGGSHGRRGAAVAGAPRFEAGRNYLLFLERAPAQRWRSRMLAYGLLRETGEELRPLPEAEHIEAAGAKTHEPVGVYRKRALLDHLKSVAGGKARWNRQSVEAPQTAGAPLVAAGAPYTSPPSCAFLFHDADGIPIRWFGYETGSTTSTVVATTPGQTGISDGGVSAVQQGVAAWTGHPDSVIRLNYGGTRARAISCTGNFDYEDSAVVFNDPCNDLADLSSSCAGTLAFGGTLYDPTTTRPFDGQAWHPAMSTFVILNNGAQCVGETGFKEVVSHELGHTQGFGHHYPPNPAEALMSPNLKGDGQGAAIRPLDKVCAAFAYHTFLDVQSSHPFWRYIEAVENAGFTTGCVSAQYCPDNLITRSEMAVFLVRGIHGSGFTPPPATGRVFFDVPASYWAASWIEQLYADGITTGCRAGLFCPDQNILRSEMAAFLVRAKYGRNFQPPPATGAVFQDVPASYWAAAHIEKIFNDGITTGCAANPRRYCPENLVHRDEMAAFLARTFGLPIP